MTMITHFSNIVLRTGFPTSTTLVSKEQLLFVNYKLKDLNPDNDSKSNYSYQKYLQRLRHRCTPYGLFAGVNLVKIADETNIVLSNECLRQTSLDSELLCQLLDFFNGRDSITPYIKYFSNNTIYLTPQHVRYFEFKISNHKGKKYFLSSVTKTSFLLEIIEAARNGATKTELIKCLVLTNASLEEKERYINTLIDQNILISELSPTVLVDNPLNSLIHKLQDYYNNAELQHKFHIGTWLKNLKGIQKELISADQNGLSDDNLKHYNNIYEFIAKFNVKIDDRRLFHCNLIKQAIDPTINREVIDKVITAVKVVSKFFTYPTNSDLEKFKKAFVERWQFEEIPLSIALDSVLGIGYPVGNIYKEEIIPPLKDLDSTINIPQFDNGQRYSFWLRNLVKAEKENSYSIELNSRDVELFDDQLEYYTNTFSALASVFQESGSEFVHLKTIYCGDGSSLFQRFAQTNDAIKEFAKEIVSADVQDDVIIADIIHWPENIAGNILQRPDLGGYKIPILDTHANENDAIYLSDLYVSVVYNRLVIKSKKLNKAIIPRLRAAHNYTRTNFPLYKFLCDVQLQNTYLMPRLTLQEFEWHLKFIPRIVYEKSIILKPATWYFSKTDLGMLLDMEDDIEIAASFQAFKEKWNFPKYITISEGDNDLLINTQEIESIKLFIHEAKKTEYLMLKEALSTAENTIVTDITGNKFVNEIIVPLRCERANESHHVPIFYESDNTKRVFYPGSECMHVKIYTSITSAENMLIRIYDKIISKEVTEGNIGKWFFVKYIDDGNKFHIRLRLFLNNHSHTFRILNSLTKELIDQFSGQFSNIKLENYERELERYGFNNIINAEAIFFIDSETSISLLKLLKQASPHMRMIAAISLVYTYLDACNFTAQEKKEYIMSRPERFGLYHSNKRIRIVLDSYYRLIRSELNSILIDKTNTELQLIMDRLNSELAVQFNILKTRLNNSKLCDLLDSYIHMSMNRIFEFSTNKYEYATYYLAKKHAKFITSLNSKKELN